MKNTVIRLLNQNQRDLLLCFLAGSSITTRAMICKGSTCRLAPVLGPWHMKTLIPWNLKVSSPFNTAIALTKKYSTLKGSLCYVVFLWFSAHNSPTIKPRSNAAPFQSTLRRRPTPRQLPSSHSWQLSALSCQGLATDRAEPQKGPSLSPL